MRHVAIGVLALVCVVSPAAQPRSIDDFFREFSDAWVRLNPNLAIAARYFSGEEQDRLEQQITSYTEAARARRREQLERGLSELARFDRAQLTDTQRVSADLLRYQVQTWLDWEKYDPYEFPLDQFNGANIWLVNTLTVQHPLRTPKDASNYVVRLGVVGARMAEAVEEAKERAAKDLIPPRFILTRTIDQMRRFASTPTAQNPLVTSFNERASQIKDLTAADRAALVAKAERIVSETVYPQWKAAIGYLESLLPRSSDNAGLWRFEGGAEAYAFFLKGYTTTNLTADQIHAIGLRQVARLERDMDVLLRKLGRSTGTVKERVAQMKKDLSYPLTEDGRKQIMADIDAMIRDAAGRSALLFDVRPKGPVIAQPYPRFREANAAASYTPPPLDGSRPAVFQMPLRPERMTKFELRTLVHHETVPGHHFQIALMVETRRCRRSARRGCSAAFPPSPKAGRFTPNVSRQSRAGTPTIRKACSGRCRPSCSAPGASSSIRACTPSAGRGSRRSITASRPARSSAMSSLPDRPVRTCSAS